jgi:hypothetical protein
MNENRPPQEDSPPQIVCEDGDGEQLQIPIPPADGLSSGEWMETLPKKGQYRSRWVAAA